MRSHSPQLSTRHRHSFLRSLFYRPQQLWLRRAIFQVHLWAGILLALYVTAIGISGSILVFKEELFPRPHPAMALRDLRHCTPEALVNAIELVNRTHPSRKAYLASCPDEANPLFAVTARSKRGASRTGYSSQVTAYVDPASGLLAGEADRQDSWIQWVDNFHVYLLLGPSGRQWNGAGAAILFLLVITGMALWWPGVRRWRGALLIRWRANWKRLVWNSHNATGFWTLFFTVAWALTGIYFAWPRAFTSAINSISPVVTARYPEAELDRLTPPPNEPSSFDLETVLQHAVYASPDGALEGCFYGSGPRAFFTVYMARGHLGDYAKTDFEYFDQSTGKLLYIWHRGENHTLGDWLLWLAVPLHFGTSWGLAGKIAWALLGLVLPLLAVTGLIMYWNRFLSKKKVGKARPMHPPDAPASALSVGCES